MALAPDSDAEYDEVVNIDLSALRPLAACPHSPDAVKTVEEIGPIKVDQCCIGSCTNSSLYDMLKVAAILKGKTVHPDVSLSHRAWIQAGAGHARGKRRPRRPDRRGCPHPRMRLRPLHRYGPVSQFRRHFPSDLQSAISRAGRVRPTPRCIWSAPRRPRRPPWPGYSPIRVPSGRCRRSGCRNPSSSTTT